MITQILLYLLLFDSFSIPNHLLSRVKRIPLSRHFSPILTLQRNILILNNIKQPRNNLNLDLSLNLNLTGYFPIINPGSQVLSDGKATRANRKTTSIARKGATPSTRSLLEILKTFFTKKKLIAMGGVISAISILTSYNIANQSGLRPNDTIKGIKIGIVINIIVIPSIKHPRINRRTCIQITTNIGFGPRTFTQAINCFDRDPLPTIPKKITRTGQTLFSEENLSGQVTAPGAGPSEGFRVHLTMGTIDSKTAKRSPGTIPAIRRRPNGTTSPAIAEIIIAVALGGINGPSTPPQVRAPRLIFLS